jgi:hypothetical protein
MLITQREYTNIVLAILAVLALIHMVVNYAS